MTIAKKKVKYPENPSLMSISNMHDFVAACAKQWSDKAFEFKSIQIEAPATEQPLTVLSEALMHSDNLSFQISATDITRIMNQIILILRQPNLVAELLKDLDHALSEEMKKNGIQFSEKDLPEYVIAGKGHFIPGPPPEGYHPRKKARILDALLLKREMDQNVNPEGVSPKFTGFVDFEKADPFVAAGHIFTENKQVSRLLLHGSLTHRIIIDAIWRAKENGKLNFQYGDGKELSLKQLIELLVNTTHYFDVRKIMSLWTITIDYLGDTKYAPNADSNFLNTDNYSFSCRSPFVLNSLLLNFGAELGLPHLQHYMLDSHWKAAYQMVNRVRQAIPDSGIADSTIYTYCMEALSTAAPDRFLGDVGIDLPFTLPEAAAHLSPGYVPFDTSKPIKGIVKKANPPAKPGEYVSWQEYLAVHNQLKGPTIKTVNNDNNVFVEPPAQEYFVQSETLPSVITEQPMPKLTLFNSYEVKPLVEARVEYQQMKSWMGIYDMTRLYQYLYEMENIYKKNYIDISINLTNTNAVPPKTISISYNALTGWKIIDNSAPNTYLFTSKYNTTIVEKLFSILDNENKNLISLSSQFSITKLIFDEEIEKVKNKLDMIEGSHFSESLKLLSNDAKIKFMQDAFRLNNKYICLYLIKKGVNFYSSYINIDNPELITLYNELCEAQAKQNILDLKRTIFHTSWDIKFTGKVIYGRDWGYDESGKRVPATVKAEFDEITAAEAGEKSYYDAWKTIILIRKEAAQHNNDRFKFFRNQSAKDHYQQAYSETPCLPLKIIRQ